MNVLNLLESGVNLNITLTPKELIEVINHLVEKTKMELEEQIVSKKMEVYMTTKEVCEFLKVDSTTLWRWDNRGYVKPIYIGGKKRYPRTEIEKRFTTIHN